MKDGFSFNLKLSLKPEGRGTYEERALREYEEGLEEENVLKVSCLMRALRHQQIDYLHGPCAVVLALAYYCDQGLFSRLVATSATPVFINLICEDPEYAFDLEALWMIAENGGLWARVEVFHHLILLFGDCNKVVSGLGEQKEVILSRAFRRLAAVYLGRVITLLLATKKTRLLGYVFDAVLTIYQDSNDRFLLYFLGKYVGKGISLYLSKVALKRELAGWEPGRHSWGLMYLLYGAQVVLENESVELMCVLNRALIGKWLALVWKAYRGLDEADYVFLPFTALDLAVWKALAKRWKTKHRSLRFLNGICRRLRAVEGMWFGSSIAEEQRRKALYGGLLAHARAWSMLPPDESISLAAPAIDFIRSYIADQRNWERVPGGEDRLKMPSFFGEILACLSGSG